MPEILGDVHGCHVHTDCGLVRPPDDARHFHGFSALGDTKPSMEPIHDHAWFIRDMRLHVRLRSLTASHDC